MSSKKLKSLRDRTLHQKNSLRKIRYCQKCGVSQSKEKLYIHHIKPLVAGGTNEAKNLMKVCKRCHKELDILT